MSRANITNSALLVAVAIMLGGCSFTPVRSPQTALPAVFESGQASGLEQQKLDSWWLLFADSQLDALIDEALASAPDARRALARLSEARAERSRAGTDYYPQGSVTASATRQHSTISDISSAGSSGPGLQSAIPGTSTTLDAGFNPSWELDLFGRAAANNAAANADFAAARFDYEASRQSLAANVAANLFEARGLATQLGETQAAARIAHDLAEIGNKRAKAGIGSHADAASLNADAATADARELSLEAQLAISKRSLLVLTGRATTALESLVIEPRLDDVPPLPTTAPGDLLIRRPDVRAAEARMRSAAGRLRLDQLALFPTFNLLPGAAATKIEGPIGYTSKLWSLGIGLSLPILDRPRLMAQIHAQDARTEQAAIAYEMAVQQAYGEAESRLTALASDQNQLAHLRDAEQESRAAFEADRLGYRNGIVDLSTLLATERTWRTNLAALSSLRAAALVAAVDAFKALGGGWTPPEFADSTNAGTQP